MKKETYANVSRYSQHGTNREPIPYKQNPNQTPPPGFLHHAKDLKLPLCKAMPICCRRNRQERGSPKEITNLLSISAIKEDAPGPHTPRVSMATGMKE